MRVETILLVFFSPSLFALLGQSLLADALNLEGRTSLSPSTSTSANTISRRGWLQTAICGGVFAGTITHDANPAVAAPPIAVIAEELGYFPVQNKAGDLMYVPKKVQRESTQQAIELAKLMNEKGVKMYGAYWCPHCSRQKELFGAEAWRNIEYVECSPKGYGFKGTCKNVDGYPTFMDKRGKINFSGERSLADLAKQVGYSNFDPSLEGEVPMVGTACKLR